MLRVRLPSASCSAQDRAHVWRLEFACICGAVSLLATADTRGDGAADLTGRHEAIVARIGPVRAIHASELEASLRALPPFQRTAFGSTPDVVRRHFLMEILVPQALLALGGDSRQLANQPRVAYEIERARSSATLRVVRERIGAAAAISMQDVLKYYEDNRTRYDTPERYHLWRILCPTPETALFVLEQIKRDPTPAKFGELARDHSLDKATSLRDGNLGFLTADGSSNEPGLRVDPAIVHAAQGVRDGEIVPTTVAEGPYFSVVWRRGTIAGNKRKVDAVAAQIRDALWKSRVKEATDALLVALRAAKLRDYNNAVLEDVDLFEEDAGVR
jgi:peptidyl-prolyl cis-trans isomerase C